MSFFTSTMRLWTYSFSILAVLSGCGGEEEYKGFDNQLVKPGTPSIDAREQIQKNQESGIVEKERRAEKPSLGLPQLSESDFIQSPKNRDPFKPFMEVIGQDQEILRQVQRDIKLKDYDVSELQLIGIITNISNPRAMVVTPDGTGFVLRRGDFVGRADFVDQGSGSDKIQVNWRVARIQGSGKDEERGIFLVRDDPTTKNVDVTRFIPLHPPK